MCKLFFDNESVIREYCEKNGLNFEKAKHSPKSWHKTDYANILYFDEEDKSKVGLGLLDETPMPVTLKIFNTPNGLLFEQTEHTARYLTV